jgi:hypothetical protein
MKWFAKFISADGLMARRRIYDRPPCIYLRGSDIVRSVSTIMSDSITIPTYLRTVRRRYDLISSNRCGEGIIEYIYQENLHDVEFVEKGD